MGEEISKNMKNALAHHMFFTTFSDKQERYLNIYDK